MTPVVLIILFVVGACIGSFLCCQARRLHIRASSTKHSKLGKRSVCLHCHRQLTWYDNIPVISWLVLRGKCRQCGASIGAAELLAELGLGISFLALGTTLNIDSASALEWGVLIATLLLVTVLGFLAIYDGLYGELPVLYLTISIICAILVLTLKLWALASVGAFSMANIWYTVVSVAILGGLYLVLYIVSRGKWVGDGDWLLGTAIGLALANPWLAVVALFVANAVACLVMLPRVKGGKDRRIYFGPFMVVGYIVATVLAEYIVALLPGGML